MTDHDGGECTCDKVHVNMTLQYEDDATPVDVARAINAVAVRTYDSYVEREKLKAAVNESLEGLEFDGEA